MNLHDPALAGTTAGMMGRWNGPVATTTLVASITPSEVSAAKPEPSAFLAKGLDLDTAADGSCDLLRVGFEILHDPVFGGKAAGIDVGERHAWKSVMPGRTVGDERVPSFRAPALGNPMPFDDEMRHAAFAQVLAHRQPGLTAAYDERLDLFNRHARTLLRRLGDFSRCGLDAVGRRRRRIVMVR